MLWQIDICSALGRLVVSKPCEDLGAYDGTHLILMSNASAAACQSQSSQTHPPQCLGHMVPSLASYAFELSRLEKAEHT